MKCVGLNSREKISNVFVYVILVVMSVLWIVPIVWVVLTSFRAEQGALVSNFFPETFTFDNYKRLFTDTTIFNFPQWFWNTFWVASVSCVLTTVMNLTTAYVISRLRFRLRRTFMNIALVLGMFPAFMSMIAVYYVLKSINLTHNLWALVIVYSASAGLQFYVAKGFFDTIPRSLDESAKLDGANNAQIFWKIILPLSKPIVVYTALTAFMAPWMDFIFSKIIMGTEYDKYTVAVGLFTMLDKENIDSCFTLFAAGSVCIAVPITILFIVMQRFYVDGITGGAVKG